MDGSEVTKSQTKKLPKTVSSAGGKILSKSVQEDGKRANLIDILFIILIE